jgi:hypothetical protein
LRIEFRLQEQLGERRVGLIGSTAVETHLRVARQLEVAAVAPVVDQRHDAQLGIRIRYNAHGTASLDVAIAPTKLGAVGADIEVGRVA